MVTTTSPEKIGNEHKAIASLRNVDVSTKHCIELSNALRYKKTNYAKQYLERVINLQQPVPFKRFNHNMGHKPGMSAGRYPQKAARNFLTLIRSVEANAQAKGLNTTHLKIIKLLANKASIPSTGKRSRTRTKRTHVEIEVAEVMPKAAVAKGNVAAVSAIPEMKKSTKKEKKIKEGNNHD